MFFGTHLYAPADFEMFKSRFGKCGQAEKEENHPRSHHEEIIIIDHLGCLSSLPLLIAVLFLVFENKEI